MEKTAFKLSKWMFFLFFVDIIVNSSVVFFNAGAPLISSTLIFGPLAMNYFIAPVAFILGCFFWIFHHRLSLENEIS